jgi:hypothetical protein
VKPGTQQYLDAADRNLTIARSLLDHFTVEVEPIHDDWVITITFYSAVHFVNAYLFESSDLQPDSHAARDRLIRNDPILFGIGDEYRSLKNLSQRARYSPLAVFPPHAVQQAFDQLDVIRQTITDGLPTT